jgi:hypothetical protein
LDSIFTLNEIGAYIWSLLNGDLDVGNLINAIRDEYDVEKDTATQDVTELLQAMEQMGLIRRV